MQRSHQVNGRTNPSIDVTTLTKDPEKKIPSTAANAIKRSAKVLRRSDIHFKAQSAFLAMQGTARAMYDIS